MYLLMAISCAVWAIHNRLINIASRGLSNILFNLKYNMEINTINEKGEETKDAEQKLKDLMITIKGS